MQIGVLEAHQIVKASFALTITSLLDNTLLVFTSHHRGEQVKDFLMNGQQFSSTGSELLPHQQGMF